jgi:putative restriction endonuclease
VLTLGDYLDLTEPAAGEQWAQVLGRPAQPPEGKTRQGNFTPVETLLCFAASLAVNINSYGGKTAHLMPTPVPELAVLFRRTPGSILAKMLNLNGSWANGAKHEVELSKRLLTNPGLAVALYQRILTAARARGIAEVDLPDFLDAELPLLGQDGLSDTDIAQAVSDGLAASGADEDSAKDTQAIREVAVRVGQYRFARGVLDNSGHGCVFCGFSPGPTLAGRGLLRASHIKPWRDADNTERVDVQNGLAACPTHDAAFDAGLLLVTDDLEIEISPILGPAMVTSASLAAVFSEPILAKHLILPARADRPKAGFLEWHRIKVAAPAVRGQASGRFDWSSYTGSTKPPTV